MTGKKILLVDYDPKSLTHTRTILQGAGFDVSTCGDGLSAIDQFKSEAPDLVLLSAMLPKMHGFEVCSNIRKLPRGDKTPVVIITDVYKGKRYRVDAIQKYGATEYIEKPIEDANLISILKGLVNGGAVDTVIENPNAGLEEKTVQFDRDALMDKLNVPAPQAPAPRAPEKKPVEKSKSKTEMDRKLEESLAGLELSVSRPRPKPKPAVEPKPQEKPVPAMASAPEAPSVSSVPQPAPVVAPAAVPAATAPERAAAAEVAAPESGPPTVVLNTNDVAIEKTFTSEELFTDVIASVERELQSEKLITKSGVQEPASTIIEKPAAPVQPRTTEPFPAISPATPPKPEPPKKASSTFDTELEKKLSDTLSGLMKERPAAQPKTASVPAPQKPESAKAEPARPVPAAKPEPVSPPSGFTAAPIAVTPEEPPASPTLLIGREKPQESAVAVTEDGINFGQYLLLSKIATGGMAELFKAKRKGVEGFEKILAIKKILPHMSDNEEFITMFIDEAKLAAQLSHHNICQIFDLGKIENSYYIAMEYVHGKDLRAVLKAARQKSKPIPVELAILITSKICSALDYAHRKRDVNGHPLNLVHRDVSPQNILISYEGDVKLVDFGIAKAATKVHITQHGALKGKLLYMSPEQAWGRSVDRKSDVFSVGVVLHEMLAGRPLFFDENDTEVTILDKVREARIVPIREMNRKVSPELERIIFKALKKNPEDRYQLASEMQKDLDNLFYTEGYNATSASLATFARSLFPEEWGLETGSKDTVMIDREMGEAMKAALPAAAARHEASPPAPAPAPPKAVEPIPAAKPAAAPPTPAAKPVVAAEPVEHTAVRKAIKTTQEPHPKPHAEPEKKGPITQPDTAAPAAASGFRDISMPDIIPAQPDKSNTMKVVLGIVAVVLLVGAIAVYLFRAEPGDQTSTQTPSNQSQRATQPQPSPTPANTVVPTPAPVQPSAATEEQSKLELQKKIEEEQKKLNAIKQEEAKKAEDQKQAAELAKLQEQQKADQLKAEQLKAEQQKAEQQKADQLKQQQATPAAETPAPQPEQQAAQPQPAQEQPAPEPAQAEPEPAQPQVQEGDLVELTPDVIKPGIVTRVEPAYPPIAKTKKIEGTVILSVLVSESGRVSDVKVLREAGGSMGLNEAAVAAVKQWKFRPAVKAGKRVKVWVSYPIVFKVQ